MSELRKFIVNEYITLKLEGSNTIIYVNGERFNQCKYLFISLPHRLRRQINSIDQAVDYYSNDLEENSVEDYGLTVEQIFWGHSSNLQAWAENDYDTRLLHSNLAFPLLKRLTEVGDIKAKKIFKTEIVKRFKEGDRKLKLFLDEEGFLEPFSQEEYYNLHLKKKHQKILSQIALEYGKTFLQMFSPRSFDNREIVNLSFYNKIPKSVRKLKNTLLSLRLAGRIKELPDWLGGLTKLRNLCIHAKYLRTLPDFFGNFKFLNSLSIRNCSIREIPNSLGLLTNLQKLHINNANLSEVPKFIGNLGNLEELNLYGNQIKEVPEILGSLKNLKILNLGDNKISKFPTFIQKLKKLETISFAENPINIPSWLEKFSLMGQKIFYINRL